MTRSETYLSDFDSHIAAFGRAVAAKFANPTLTGDPEDQLRGPLEILLIEMDQAAPAKRGEKITVVGEHRKSELKLRLDFAISRGHDLLGYVEIKAPGKGADPNRFNNSHDKEQWEKLKSIPNLIYTDGNEFSLWRYGVLVDAIVRLEGDVTRAKPTLKAPAALSRLLQNFYGWDPEPPQSVKELAELCAKLCRLLRDELSENMQAGHRGLDMLHQEWRELLFPESDDAVFADSFAQAVTFGLVLAKVGKINMKLDFPAIARELAQQNSFIGAALRYISDDDEVNRMLAVSLRTLRRVLEGFEWDYLGDKTDDSWLYFYEDFLAAYDAKLRKSTGSYYTPPEIVNNMIRLVDDTLRDPKKFNLSQGLAAPSVQIIDPAMGTGTYLLGIIRHIAKRVTASEGAGSVKSAVKAALTRMIGFEFQFGPFVVAQTRLLSEFSAVIGEKLTENHLRLYLDNTLEDPENYVGNLPGVRGVLVKSRNQANEIKLKEDIRVVIGNPPYKEQAKGKGAWVESGYVRPKTLNDHDLNSKGRTNFGGSRESVIAPLAAWKDAPKEWGISAHLHKLSNLYVYFWRWASWKVFGGEPILDGMPTTPRQGLVCFISMAGFLDGKGFQKMRADLRRDADEIWVINCTPEGHQPNVPDRIFPDVQQACCIVLAVRFPKHDNESPAPVYYRELPKGLQKVKFDYLDTIQLGDGFWKLCDDNWRMPFLPKMSKIWANFQSLDSIFINNYMGVMPGRVWPFSPDVKSLVDRWKRLISENDLNKKDILFHPHPNGDRTIFKTIKHDLFGHRERFISIVNENEECLSPIAYSFRSFDRQYIIPDNRLINRPSPAIWQSYSEHQIFLTAPIKNSTVNGAAITFASHLLDIDHNRGKSGGRVFPLWQNAEATVENISQPLRETLEKIYREKISGEKIMAYIAAIAAHPAYTNKFKADLQQPGLRIPLTRSPELFHQAVELGQEIIWLHCYGERFYNDTDRPHSPPRLPAHLAPRHSGDKPIPDSPEKFPDKIDYQAEKQWLLVGDGVIENVQPAMWNYDVSGKKIVKQWFSYRRKNRERPIMGDRRTPSELGKIQPDHWLPEYTTDLLDLLHVLGRVLQLEPAQKDMLNRICDGELIAAREIPLPSFAPKPARAKKLKGDQPNAPILAVTHESNPA
ncbi:MAG: N-6 DNA methylase [Candidatus Symbiobacter sp.]|nr:N-6 DNA methylase [Candidatus Symbiobacter sp.]